MNWRIGCCGWAKGRETYYRQFDVVEVQQTFYKLPKQAGLARAWREAAPKDFEFVLKASQLVTHLPTSPTYRRLGHVIPESKASSYGFFRRTREVRKARQEIEKMAQELRSTLLLYQCPPSFKDLPENRKNLKRFFARETEVGCALELRGTSWESESILEYCRELGVLPVVDPLITKPLHGATMGYFRLHGLPAFRYGYAYTADDLQTLYDRLNVLPIKTCYVMFNNFSMYRDAVAFQALCEARAKKTAKTKLKKPVALASDIR